MVAAKLASMKSGERTDLSSFDPRSVSQPQAAAMLNVSVPTVKRSKKVLTSGIPELQDMVTGGEVSAKAASEVAKLPPADQRKAVKRQWLHPRHALQASWPSCDAKQVTGPVAPPVGRPRWRQGWRSLPPRF